MAKVLNPFIQNTLGLCIDHFFDQASDLIRVGQFEAGDLVARLRHRGAGVVEGVER